MRTAALALAALALVSVSAASASIVIHDGQAGIVAHGDNGYVLDRSGHFWDVDGGGWHRHVDYDLPVPVSQVQFWTGMWFTTFDDHVWEWVSSASGWLDLGAWPASGVPETMLVAGAASPKPLPNPAVGSCRISFAVPRAGAASAMIVDVDGRRVRELLSGTLPAGDYAPTWDGRDDAGRDAPAGVYLVRISTPAGETSGKVVLSR